MSASVVAPVAVDRVVAVAADQRLRAGAAGERVVAVAAVERRRDGVGEDAVASSMRTQSSPPRASTAILAIELRRKLKSAEPSSPTSTWSMSGRPAFRRRAILSPARVPAIVSVPCFSFGVREWPPVAVRGRRRCRRGGVGRPGGDAAAPARAGA